MNKIIGVTPRTLTEENVLKNLSMKHMLMLLLKVALMLLC